MEHLAAADAIWAARWPILTGLGLSLVISALSILLGTALGLGLGILLTYGGRPLRFLIRLYVDFLRGTPVFVLILAAFYVLAVVGIDLTPMQAGVFSLSLFCSAHVAEILRGALQSIPRGQTEAAKAIGLTFRQTLVSVLLPQAGRQILPVWVNTATEIVKASTLLSVIGVVELLLAVEQVIARTYLSLDLYFFAGLVFFLINFAIERAGRRLERRLAIPT